MERFAIKIDERVKLNLYNICRLCGIDNRDQVPIVDDPDGTFTIEDEPSLCKKIVDCVGIQVTSTDKMPQKMCTLCVDKINDFYEYREMCKATNFQTRELLGLPPENVKDEKPPLQQDPPPTPQQPLVELPPTGIAMKRKRKLKSECISYEEVDDDEIDEKPPKKKIPKPSVGAAKKKFLPARKILVKRESVKALPPRILPNREKAIPVLREKLATLNNKEKLLTPPIKEKGLALREKSIGLREKVLALKEKSTPVKEKPTIKEKPMTVKEKHLLLKEKTIKEKVVTPPVKENRLVTREKLQAAKEKLTPPIKDKPILIKEKPQKAILEKEKLKPARDKSLSINSKLPILNAKQNKEKGIIKEKLNISIEDKKNEPTSSKIDTDLITLKTPNRRERQRELETKKKRKVPVLPPVEKVKTENLFLCIVCPKDFKTQPEYDLHFFRDHTPNTLEHGCSACREAFYDLQEYRDHQLWHRLSTIPFSCFKCNSQFDRITGYTRHFLTSCVPPIEYDIVDDIKCPKCQKTFVTKNLYEWHGCLIKNNTKCPRCSKFFAKRLHLQRHVVLCAGKKIEPKPVKVPAPAPVRNKNTESVEPEKTLTAAPTNDTNKIVKVEPESALEIEEETQVSVSNKNNDDEDREIEDSVADDVGFQDENDDAEEDTTANDSSVIDESANVANEGDDDVIVISDNEEHVAVLPVKQEKVDRRYEEVISRASANIPMVQIKQEVLNSNYTDNNVDVTVLRNIKPEPAEAEPAVSTVPVSNVSEPNKSTDAAPSAPAVPEITNQTSRLAAAKPTLKLKIKKEHGTLNSSFIEPGENEDDSSSPNRNQSNDDEAGNNPHRKRRNKHKKKIYKIPKQLALIIKQEKESRTESAENSAIDAESQITVPVISEVTSIAATVLDSRKEVNQSDYFAEEADPSMSASFPGDSLETSANTEPAVRDTNIQIPVIAEVVSLKQSEPSVPFISSVTSLSQSSGIRVKTEFNNFVSPTSEELTTIDSRIEQDDMITGNYHMEYDENPENDFEQTDSEEVPLSTSKDSIESEIDEKPNLLELMIMSTVGQVSSSASVPTETVAIIKLEKSPHITEPSKEREPAALRVKNLESLKSKSQDGNCRQRHIGPNAEKAVKKRFTPTTTLQNASCDRTEALGTENQSVGVSVNIKLEPSDIDEFSTTDIVGDVNAEFQSTISDNVETVKTEAPSIETDDEFVPLDSAINSSVKAEPLSTETDGELYNMEEDEINIPTTETESDHEMDLAYGTSYNVNNDKCTESSNSEAVGDSCIGETNVIEIDKVVDIVQNIKVELPIADTGDDDVEMDVTIDKSINVKEEKSDEEGVGSGFITNTMDVTMDDSDNGERGATSSSELPTINTSDDRNIELEVSEINLPNINQVDAVEQNNSLFPTLEADNNGVAEFRASEVSLETGTTDGDMAKNELKEKGTDQVFVGDDNVEMNVAALPTTDMGGDSVNAEVCGASETNLPIGRTDNTENVNATMPSTETFGGSGNVVVKTSQPDLPIDSTDNLEKIEVEFSKSETSDVSVNVEVCDACELDLPISSPDNVATNEAGFSTTEMADVSVKAEACEAIETNLPIGNMENVKAIFSTTDSSVDGGNVEVKVNQTDLPIGSTHNLENNEVEFRTTGTSDECVNVEVCDTCETDLPIGSPDNVTKYDARFPITERTDGSVNVEICKAIQTNLPISSSHNTENVNDDSSRDGGNVEVKADQTDPAIGSTDNLEKDEVEFQTTGTSDECVNVEVCDACETDLPIGSTDNVTKDDSGIPTTEMTDGNVNAAVYEAIESNLPIASSENTENVNANSGDDDNVEVKANQTDLPINSVDNLEKVEVEFKTSMTSDECVNVVVCDAYEMGLPIGSPDNVTKDEAGFPTTETTDGSINAEVCEAIETNLPITSPDTMENVTAKMPTTENTRDGGIVELKPNETDLSIGSVDNLEMDASINSAVDNVNAVASDACETGLPISSQDYHDMDKTTTRNTETSGDGDNVDLKASKTDLNDSTDNNENSPIPITEVGDAVVIEFKASEPTPSVGIAGNEEEINATISTIETDVMGIVSVEFKVSEIEVVKSNINSDNDKTDNTQFQTTETDLVLPAQISVPVIPIKRPLETDDDSEESKPKIQKMSECHLEITNRLELHDNEVILPKPDGLVTSVEALISEMEESGQRDTTPIETESNVAHNQNLNTTENITCNQNIRNNQIIEKSIPDVPEQENQIQQPFLIENKIIEAQDTVIQPNQDGTNNIAECSTDYENYAMQTNEDLHQEINDKQLLESSITTKENNFGPIQDLCDIVMGEPSVLENVDHALKNKCQIPQENCFIIQQEEFSVSSAKQHDESHYNENDVNMETEESNIEHNVQYDQIQFKTDQVRTNEDVSMQPHDEVCNMDESDIIENIIIQPEAVNGQISNHIEKETDNSMIIIEQVLPAAETSSSNLDENFEEDRPAKVEVNYKLNVISEETCSTIEATTQETRLSEILDSELINKEQEESLKNLVDEEQSQQGLDIINELNVLNCESSAAVIDENMSDVYENVGPLCSSATERKTQSNVEECEQCPDLIEQLDELSGDSCGSIKVENVSVVPENVEKNAKKNVCLNEFENDKPLGELQNPEKTFYKSDSNETPLHAEVQPMTQEANQYADLDETTSDSCTSSSEENNSGLSLQEERTAQQENMDDDYTSTTISDTDTSLEDLTKSDENLYEPDCIIINTEGPTDERVESTTNEIHQCPDVIIEISDDSSESSMEQDSPDEILSENLDSKVQTEAVQLTIYDSVNYLDEISDDSCEYSMEEESTNIPLNVTDYNNQPQEDNCSTSVLDTEIRDHAKQTENLNTKLNDISDDSNASPKPANNSEENIESSYRLGSSSEMHEENTKVSTSSDSRSHSTNSESERNVADTLDFIKPVVMNTFEVPSCDSTDAIGSVSSLQIHHEAPQIPVNPSTEYQTTIASNIETVAENVPSNLDAVRTHENLNDNLDEQTNPTLAAVSEPNENEDIDSDLEKELLEEIQ